MSFFKKKNFLINRVSERYCCKKVVQMQLFQTYITKKENKSIFKILKCELKYKEFKIWLLDYIIFFYPGSLVLNDLKVKLFKLASFDISNYQLISEKQNLQYLNGNGKFKWNKKGIQFFLKKLN